MEPYQFSSPLSRSNGERGEKHFQKTILTDFKATYVENSFRTRLKAQFWLDFSGTCWDGWYCGELELWTKQVKWGGAEDKGHLIPEFWENENLTTNTA